MICDKTRYFGILWDILGYFAIFCDYCCSRSKLCFKKAIWNKLIVATHKNHSYHLLRDPPSGVCLCLSTLLFEVAYFSKKETWLDRIWEIGLWGIIFAAKFQCKIEALKEVYLLVFLLLRWFGTTVAAVLSFKSRKQLRTAYHQNLHPLFLPTIYNWLSIVNSAQIKGRWNLVFTAKHSVKKVNTKNTCSNWEIANLFLAHDGKP